MTYCPNCKKWKHNLTTVFSTTYRTQKRTIKQCRKCGTMFIPDGKRSQVWKHEPI